MDLIEIVTLPPSQREDYKNLRLRALQEEPQAYETKYEDALAEPPIEWQKRLEASEIGKTQLLSFAKLNGNLVGMAAAWRPENEEVMNVVSVFIAKEARGKGISKKLLSHLIESVKKNEDVKTLRLEVNPNQTPAYKLYEGLGFKKVGVHKIVLGDGKEYEDHIMELELY